VIDKVDDKVDDKDAAAAELNPMAVGHASAGNPAGGPRGLKIETAGDTV